MTGNDITDSKLRLVCAGLRVFELPLLAGCNIPIDGTISTLWNCEIAEVCEDGKAWHYLRNPDLYRIAV